MTKKINVLSLFDGMSCGRIALERAGFDVGFYGACEIDKWAIKVSKFNYPDIVQLGDVTKLEHSKLLLGEIDLLMGGSPCQGFSLIGGQLNFDDPRSKLFFEFVRLKNELNPKYFLLENVFMKQKYQDIITEYLGVLPIEINSSLFSFQSRKRLYWTNIPIQPIVDKKINFQDFKETDPNKLRGYEVNRTPSRERMWCNGEGKNNIKACANVTDKEKVYCLTVKQDRTPNSGLIAHGDFCRYLTRTELEQAQTVPVGYTDVLSFNQAQKVLGNGWTVDAVAHIFKDMKL